MKKMMNSIPASNLKESINKPILWQNGKQFKLLSLRRVSIINTRNIYRDKKLDTISLNSGLI